MNKKLICVLVVLAVLGFWYRVDSYKTHHPDNDEFYELQQISNDMNFKRVFSGRGGYGDHTSFPGEFILYWPVLKILDVGRVELKSLGNMGWEVRGVGADWFWKASVLKGVLCVLGLFLMGFFCYRFGWCGVFGMALYSFNPHLVYHAFEMRPYSVLPVLALMSVYLARCRFTWFHLLFIFFCCIYHAYGPLIVFLPIIFYQSSRRIEFWLGCILALLVWGYYASYNMFGWSPNGVQAVVSSFEYFKPSGLAYMQSFLGSGLSYVGLLPLIFLCFLSDRVDLYFLILMIILPVMLICLVDLKTSYWIHPRQWIWVMPWFGLWVSDMLYQYYKKERIS